MAGAGERHGRGSSVPSLAGSKLRNWNFCSTASAGKPSGGCDSDLSEFPGKTPGYSHRDTSPVFATLANKRPTHSSLLKDFFFDSDICNYAITNIPESNGGNQLFLKV